MPNIIVYKGQVSSSINNNAILTTMIFPQKSSKLLPSMGSSE